MNSGLGFGVSDSGSWVWPSPLSRTWMPRGRIKANTIEISDRGGARGLRLESVCHQSKALCTVGHTVRKMMVIVGFRVLVTDTLI